MIFHTLTITNFRAVGKDPLVVNFPSQPGLYYLRGRNEVDVRLTGNGAGKSTIWEALCWLLEGKTSDGLKAESICNWDAPKGGVSVELAFSFDDDPVTIWFMRRTWKPNSWTLSHLSDHLTDGEWIDLTKDEANPVIKGLRMDFEVFLTTIFIPQEASTFLDLKAEVQTSMFSRIVGLEKWTEYSTKASRMANEIDRSNRLLESQVAELTGRLDAGVADYAKQITQFEEQRKRRLDDLMETYQSKLKQYQKAKDQYRETEDELRKLKPKADTLRKELKEEEQSLDDLDQEVDQLSRKFGQWKIERDRLAKEVDSLAKHRTCPTCGQDLDGDEFEKHLTRTNDRLRSLEGSSISSDLDQAEREADDQRQVVIDLREQWAKLDQKYAKLDSAEREGSREVGMIERDLDRLEDEASVIESERNPFRDAQKEASGRARSTQDALKNARQRLDLGYSRFSLYALWIKGFKEVRLQEIKEALDELTLEVNNSLVSLGLVGWEMRFEVDRENRKGTVQRGFSVLVKSPTTDKMVPWLAWSGGERQRLRLAAVMGLSNLVRSRSGVQLPLEVWDEPTKGLSPAGVRDLLTTLEQRARDEQRVIWVIDHTTHEFGGYSGGLTMVKRHDGVVVETDLLEGQ